MTKRTYKIIAGVGGLLTLAVYILKPGNIGPDLVSPTLTATFACVTILASLRAIRR